MQSGSYQLSMDLQVLVPLTLSASNKTTSAQCYKAFFRRKYLRQNFPINLKHLQNQTKTLSTVKKHLSATSGTKEW